MAGSGVDFTRLFVDRVAKGLRGLERRRPRGRDGDGLPGPRIAAGSGCAAACDELPEARDSHGLPARQRVGDGGEHDADQALGVGPGHRRPCRDVRGEFVFVHLLPVPMNGGGVVRNGAF